MDIYEKQQTIESIKTVIKARWFYVASIAGIVIILRALSPVFFAAPPMPSNLWSSLIVAGVIFINFTFWLYFRRPPEKINDRALRIIKFSQVPIDVLGLSAGFYFSGTINKVLVMLYIIPIVEGSALYKAKGIAWATIFTLFMYDSLAILEYFGLLSSVPPEIIAQGTCRYLRGDLALTRTMIIGFNFYLIGSAFYAGYLASLFKRREKRLVLQKDDLTQKTGLLTQQTNELTQTKDWLHDALSKSDKARTELSKTKDDLIKTNTELLVKIDELERFQKVTTGREIKMAELKEKIKILEDKIPGEDNPT